MLTNALLKTVDCGR